MSGKPVVFVGDTMAAVVQAVDDVELLVASRPVIVGGLAVLCRLSTAYRATTDLDIVDRGEGEAPQLEVLRASAGAQAAGPAAVTLPTQFGTVRVDVLEVRQAELDEPSDDPGDRLHAMAHEWAHATATDITIQVDSGGQTLVEVTVPVAEPGPIVAMKLQAVLDRGAAKQGTDLQDIVRVVLDPSLRERCLDQISGCSTRMALDIGEHVGLWFGRKKFETLRAIRATGGDDIGIEELELVAELLMEASAR